MAAVWARVLACLGRRCLLPQCGPFNPPPVQKVDVAGRPPHPRSNSQHALLLQGMVSPLAASVTTFIQVCGDPTAAEAEAHAAL